MQLYVRNATIFNVPEEVPARMSSTCWSLTIPNMHSVSEGLTSPLRDPYNYMYIYMCIYIYTSIWTILSTSSTAQGSGGSFKDRKLYLLVVTPNTLLKQEGLQLAEASFPYVMMSCLYILQEYHDNMSARVMLTRCKPSTNVQARPRSTSTVVAFCLEISLPASDAFNIF